MVEWLFFNEKLVKLEHRTKENKRTRAESIKEESSQMRDMEQCGGEWNMPIAGGEVASNRDEASGASTLVEWRN